MSQANDWLDKILGGKGWQDRPPRTPPPRREPGEPGEPRGPSPVQGKQVGIIAGIIVVAWGLYSSFYTVQPEERAVVKRLGRVTGITDPGLHFKMPFGLDRIQVVATERVLKQEFGFRSEEGRAPDEENRTQYSERDFPEESLMLTGDLNVIDVEWVVQYRISDPIKYLYSMREPGRTLRDITESVMRRIVGNNVGSDVLTTGRVKVATSAREEIQAAMVRYDNGIHIITVELQDVVPPARVQPAFNEVNEARQERERMINEATKQANQAIPRVQGEANRVIAEAQGYAVERVNRAKGEAQRFSAVLAEYRTAPDVTRTRMYLEALNDALPRIGSVLVVKDGQIPPVPLLNLRDAQPQRPAAPAKPKEEATP
jgi:membrane protease subunit HflK